MTDTLATKQDLQMLRQDMQALELRLINTMTLRFGAMLVAGMTVLFGLLKSF